MPANEELIKMMASHLQGIPKEYLEKIGDWMGSLRDLLAQKGIEPESVNREIIGLLEREGGGPLAQASGSFTEESLGEVARLLQLPAEVEGAAPGALPDLAPLLDDLAKIQKQNIEAVRRDLAAIGIEPDPHLDGVLKELAGEDLPDGVPFPEEPLADPGGPELPSPPEVAPPKSEEEEEPSLEELGAEIDSLQKGLQDDMGKQLEALGLAAGPILGVLFPASPEAEKRAAESLADELESEAPSAPSPPPDAEALQAPAEPEEDEEDKDPLQKLIDELDDMQKSIKSSVSEGLEKCGVDPTNIMTALFASTEVEQMDAMKAIQDEQG